MANDPEGKLIFKIKPSGNLVQLTGRPFTPVRPPRPMDAIDLCYPPTPDCPSKEPVATYDWALIGKLSHVDIATLALRIESSLDQELCLLVQISAGEGTEYLWDEKFITNDYKLQVAGGSAYVIGLDQAAQKAAEPYFAPGNTLALVVLPRQKQNLFKVVVGTAALGVAASK